MTWSVNSWFIIIELSNAVCIKEIFYIVDNYCIRFICFDGLMIETHCDPDNAWSDAAQQVTPERLVEIMRDLKVRKESDPEEKYNKELSNLRAQIDIIDNQLLETLGKRMKLAEGIGALKSKHNVAVLQSSRWNEILGRMILEGETKGLSEEFVLRMFKAIHQESINHQEKVIKS